MRMKKETIVLSVGGSLIAPESVDVEFLKSFRVVVKKNLKKCRFILMCGGGKVCRNYQAALKSLGGSNRDLDLLGIQSTVLNAHLIKLVLKNAAYKDLVPADRKVEFKNVLIGTAVGVGHSTDYDSVLLAKNYGAKTIINLTNIDKVYTDDPKTNSEAKPIDQISWKDFKEIVGSKFSPGLNKPFDPIAAKLAEKLKLKVIITKGSNMENLQNILDGKEFVGTIID